MRRAGKPQLITDAERSPEEESRRREISYLIKMGIRALCVIVAAILVMHPVPLMPLWLGLCVAGAVLLPWSAVLVANERAPKAERRFRNAFHRRAAPPPTTQVITQREHKVIDADP